MALLKRSSESTIRGLKHRKGGDWSVTSGGVRVFATRSFAVIESKVFGKWMEASSASTDGDNPHAHARKALRIFTSRCKK